MSDNFDAGYNIWVLETDHGLHFSVSHCGLPRCELSLECLQGKHLLSLLVGDLVNDTEAALSEGFEDPETFN